MVISHIAALTPHISFSTLRVHIWQDKGVGRSTPMHQMAIIDSYSIHIWQTMWWHIQPPSHMAVFQIAALTAHISFLLWELIFGRPSVGRSTPIHPSNGNDRLLLWEFIFGRPVWADLPPIKWRFHRLLLWHFIFHSHSENSYLADQVLADLPPGSNGNYRFLLWELIFGRPCVGRSTPLEWQFHRFLLWQLIFHSYSESSYLAQQDGQIYPSNSPYMADQVLADLNKWQL